MSVRKGPVFCYVFSFSPFDDEGMGAEMAVTSRIKYCDMDGDGKYELKGNGLGRILVPDWAR